MVVTGAKKEEEVSKAVEKVFQNLKEKGCIREPEVDLSVEEMLGEDEEL